MVMTMTIITIRISFCQSSDTIEIKTLLKKDDFIKSSLHFQQTNLTFSDKSKICPRIIVHMNFKKPHSMKDLEYQILDIYQEQYKLKIRQILTVILFLIGTIDYLVRLI